MRQHSFVALIIPDGNNPFFSRLSQLVQRELSVSAIGTIMLDSDSSALTEREYIRWVGNQVSQGLISAVVYIPCGDNIDNFFELFSIDLPVVILDREIPEDFADRPIDQVLADNTTGVELVAKHLASIGAYKVAYVGGPVDTEPGRVRNAAFEFSWKKAGGELIASFAGDFSFEAGRAAGDAILRLATLPEGVVAANDLMAIGVLQALQSAGKRVPEDVVLIGYDDAPLANWVFPTLTSVRQDVEEMARQTALMVVSRMAGEAGAGGMRTPILPELVARGSTKR